MRNLFSFGFIEVFYSKQKNVQDYVIGKKITTVLKIAPESITLELCDRREKIVKTAVESVTLELCNSRDYLASFLLVKKTD